MIELALIRHGMTAGNKIKRYIGATDEPLCAEGIAALAGRAYPRCEGLFISPMLRCVQTAEILYPGQPPVLVEELRECDFGVFENKNYQELADEPRYQEWIDSGGTLPFPGGESREEFSERSRRGFERIMEECLRKRYRSAAVVAHGGTIMSVLEAWGIPAGDYYSWSVGNGGGYLVRVDEDRWKSGIRSLEILQKLDEIA